MKLLVHLVRKDLRRLGLPLALWLALVAGKATALVIHAGSNHPWPGRWLETLVQYANAMEGIIGFALAAWLVLEDSPLDSRAFWPTRPVSGRLLLTAKLAGAALMFVAFPVLLLAPVWLRAGFSPEQIALAALDWGVMQGSVSLAALALAAVSRNLSQVMLGVVGMLAALLLGGVLRLDLAGGWILPWAGLTVAAAATLILQFTSRRMRPPAIFTLSAGLVLVAFHATAPSRPAQPGEVVYPGTLRQPIMVGTTLIDDRGRHRLLCIEPAGPAGAPDARTAPPKAAPPGTKQVRVEVRGLAFRSQFFGGARPAAYEFGLDAGSLNPGQGQIEKAHQVGQAFGSVAAASLHVASQSCILPSSALTTETWSVFTTVPPQAPQSGPLSSRRPAP